MSADDRADRVVVLTGVTMSGDDGRVNAVISQNFSASTPVSNPLIARREVGFGTEDVSPKRADQTRW